MLGVNAQVAFRQFAKRYHPNKLARNSGSGGDVFIEVRDAFEALKNPVVRFAYDLFFQIWYFTCLREASTSLRLEVWLQSK